MSLVRKVVDAILGHSDTLVAHERKLEALTRQMAFALRSATSPSNGSRSNMLSARTTLMFVMMDHPTLSSEAVVLDLDASGNLSVGPQPHTTIAMHGPREWFRGCVSLVALSYTDDWIDLNSNGYVLTSEADGLPAIITGEPTGEFNEYYPWVQDPRAVWPGIPQKDSEGSFPSPWPTRPAEVYGPAKAASMSTIDDRVKGRMKFNVGDKVILHWLNGSVADPPFGEFYFDGYVEPEYREAG